MTDKLERPSSLKRRPQPAADEAVDPVDTRPAAEQPEPQPPASPANRQARPQQPRTASAPHVEGVATVSVPAIVGKRRSARLPFSTRLSAEVLAVIDREVVTTGRSIQEIVEDALWASLAPDQRP